MIAAGWNPFDWRGPEFLAFYALLSLACFAWLAWWRRSIPSRLPPPRMADVGPYVVAWLRGGTRLAKRVAAASLVDRGLLRLDGTTLTTTDPSAAGRATDALEKAILAHFAVPGPVASMDESGAVRTASRELEDRLAGYGLVPARSLGERLRARAALMTAALLFVGAVKLVFALSRGRSNVGFLVLAALLVVWVGVTLSRPPRMTVRGRKLLKEYRSLLSRVKDRLPTLQRGRGGDDLAYGLAAFGFAGVPPEMGIALLAPPALPAGSGRAQSAGKRHEGGGCGSACGGYYSSAGGSGCGSGSGGGGGGCGGGGCGGGCGGCGS